VFFVCQLFILFIRRSGKEAYPLGMKSIINGSAMAAAIACAMYPAGSALAQLSLTEIMFDPTGTDTKHEWVEVKNDEAGPVDAATYKLVESGVNHKISLFGSGTSMIEKGAYAVIADDPTTFLADFPGFTGQIFDSAFSLSNTGEVLSIMAGTTIVDTVTYEPAAGGNGTGATLQKQADGSWIPALPTPAAVNSSVHYDGDPEPDGTSTSTDSGGSDTSTGGSSSGQSAHSSPVPVSTYSPKTSFQISIGRERLVSIHTPIEFRAAGKEDADFSVRWTFGDGTDKRGMKVVHSYELPATYAVVANAYERDTDSAVDRTKVTAFEPKLEVGFATTTGYWLKNRSGKELNLGGFESRLSKEAISWPPDTIVFDGQSIPLPFTRLGTDACHLKISYPDGTSLLPLNCSG
jgi:hypothetical protein